MTTQLPVGVRQAAKEWIIAKGEDFSGQKESHLLLNLEILYAKGLSLTLGFRDRAIKILSHLRYPMLEPQNGDENSGRESSRGIEASR